MTLLDTSYLINMLIKDTKESIQIKEWYNRDDLCSSVICWYEFLCGPVDEEGISIVWNILHSRIIPYQESHSRLSSKLFNETGRRRGLRVDAMIAATAIAENCRLATSNITDFSAFSQFGLEII